MTDERLSELLRDADAPMTSPMPSSDLWPRVEARFESPAQPAVPWLDLGVAALPLVALLFVPGGLAVLAVVIYHL